MCFEGRGVGTGGGEYVTVLGGKRLAADLVFDYRLAPYLFRSSRFMFSFSSLSLFPQAGARAASIRMGRRRKANHRGGKGSR
jgi:hypothetical protein